LADFNYKAELIRSDWTSPFHIQSSFSLHRGVREGKFLLASQREKQDKRGTTEIERKCMGCIKAFEPTVRQSLSALNGALDCASAAV
jgi:hypothetical protein